jgi:DNA-binding GntR family transcriptional regulator
MTQTINELGFKAGIVTRTSEIRPATKSEATDLLLQPASEVLHIERAITADGEVVAFSYDTFAIDGLSAAAIKKISTGSVLCKFLIRF